MKLEYFWADCADGSHVAVNYTFWEGQVSGSIRRWSPDGRINGGRRFDVPLDQLARDENGAHLVIDGTCEGALRIPLDASRLRQAEEELAGASA